MTQSGSTPRQGQPTVRRSQPAILIPLNRSWKSEETDEPALLTILYIYICRLCVGIRRKGADSTSAHGSEVRSNESRARRAKGRGTEKVPDETGDVTIDGSDGGGREGRKRGSYQRNS